MHLNSISINTWSRIVFLFQWFSWNERKKHALHFFLVFLFLSMAFSVCFTIYFIYQWLIILGIVTWINSTNEFCFVVAENRFVCLWITNFETIRNVPASIEPIKLYTIHCYLTFHSIQQTDKRFLNLNYDFFCFLNFRHVCALKCEIGFCHQ